MPVTHTRIVTHMTSSARLALVSMPCPLGELLSSERVRMMSVFLILEGQQWVDCGVERPLFVPLLLAKSGRSSALANSPMKQTLDAELPCTARNAKSNLLSAAQPNRPEWRQPM